MVSITTYKFLFFTKKEHWFYEGGTVSEGDYNVYCHATRDFKRLYSTYLPEQSAWIELRASSSDLFACLSRTFRYQVRKGERMNLRCTINDKPGLQECNEFVLAFNEFAAKKKISRASARRLEALLQDGSLVLTSITREGKILASHAYLRDEKKAVLLHSFHVDNHFVNYERGIANKFLHWKDILFFKESGLSDYDFGGINFETVPGISRFKMSFGAQPRAVHNFISVKPWLRPAYFLFKLISHAAKR